MQDVIITVTGSYSYRTQCSSTIPLSKLRSSGNCERIEQRIGQLLISTISRQILYNIFKLRKSLPCLRDIYMRISLIICSLSYNVVRKL